MDNFYGNTNATSGSYLGTSYTYTNGYCANRLPCGYCSLRQMMCPVYTCRPQINWNEVTCQSNATSTPTEAKNG